MGAVVTPVFAGKISREKLATKCVLEGEMAYMAAERTWVVGHDGVGGNQSEFIDKAAVNTLISNALAELPSASVTFATNAEHLEATSTELATNPAGVQAMINQQLMSNNGGVGTVIYNGAAANVHSVHTIYNDADGYTYIVQLMSSTVNVSGSTAAMTALIFRSVDLSVLEYVGIINTTVGVTPSLLIVGGVVRMFAIQPTTRILTVYNLTDAVAVALTKTVDTTFANTSGYGALALGSAVEHGGKIVFAIMASSASGNAIRLGSWDIASDTFTYVITNVSTLYPVITTDGNAVTVFTSGDSTSKILNYNVAANTYTAYAAVIGASAYDIYMQALAGGDFIVRGRFFSDGLDLISFDKSSGAVTKLDVAASFPNSAKLYPKNSDAIILNGYVYIAYSDGAASIIIQRVNLADNSVLTTNVNRTSAKGAKWLLSNNRLLLAHWDYAASGSLKIQEVAQ